MHPAPRIVETRDFGFNDVSADKALVVAAGADAEEIGVTLSLLALDAEAGGVPVVISAPIEAFATIAAEVERLARFAGIGIRLIASEGVQDACDALEAAIHATRAEALVFLSAGVLPRRPDGSRDWSGPTASAAARRWSARPSSLRTTRSASPARCWTRADGTVGPVPRLPARRHPWRRSLRGHGGHDHLLHRLAQEAIETAGGFTRAYLGAER